MLITRLKSEETITSLCSGKVFIINCHGCKEVGFPEEEANALQKKLADAGKVVGTLTTDYVCNPTELALRLRGPMAKIAEADAVLVFSCGVGVQTISETLEDKPVYACCDTVELPGFQKEEISLDLKGDVLTVTAHHQEEKETHTGKYLCRERRYGDFARSFDVSSVQQRGITAAYENGVLKLVLPKKSAVQPESSKIAIG